MAPVSVPVSLDALRQAMADFGPLAFVVTAGTDGHAHVVSALVPDTLVVSAGRTTRRNATANPAITLVWPAPAGGQYSLIVDGTAVVDDGGEQVTITPATAVLHRLAGAAGDGPTCRAVS